MVNYNNQPAKCNPQNNRILVNEQINFQVIENNDKAVNSNQFGRFDISLIFTFSFLYYFIFVFVIYYIGFESLIRKQNPKPKS